MIASGLCSLIILAVSISCCSLIGEKTQEIEIYLRFLFLISFATLVIYSVVQSPSNLPSNSYPPFTIQKFSPIILLKLSEKSIQGGTLTVAG